MKIVIDARFLGTETGIGRYIKELVEHLEKIDFHNQYIIFLRNENWNNYHPRNANFLKRQIDIPWYGLKEQLFLGKAVDREHADLCHFPHFNVPILCKTPFVVTVHDLILQYFPTPRASTLGPTKFYLKHFFYNLILKNALKKSKKIITPTYFVRNDIICKFKINPDKVRVIYEGLANLPRDADLGKEYLKGKGIGISYILYVGNAYPHKNLERLVSAFKSIKKDKDGLQLVLVGKRDYFSRRLEEETEREQRFKYQYPKDIVFYGYARDEELVTLYKNAKLYVFPSLMEGFGLPPLEALSFNIPVLCSDIPVLREVLGDGVFYFNSKNTESIKESIKIILRDDEYKVKLREEGRKILNRYNWENNAEETLSIYNSIPHLWKKK